MSGVRVPPGIVSNRAFYRTLLRRAVLWSLNYQTDLHRGGGFLIHLMIFGMGFI